MVRVLPGSPVTMGHLWQSGNRSLCVARERALPSIFHERKGRAGPCMAQPSALCVSPGRTVTTGDQANQGERMLCAPRGAALEEPSLVPRADAASEHDPIADSGEEGSPLSGQGRAPTYGTRALTYGPCTYGPSTGTR